MRGAARRTTLHLGLRLRAAVVFVLVLGAFLLASLRATSIESSITRAVASAVRAREKGVGADLSVQSFTAVRVPAARPARGVAPWIGEGHLAPVALARERAAHAPPGARAQATRAPAGATWAPRARTHVEMMVFLN